MNHLPTLIQDLALILIAAAFVGVLFRRLRLPLILGYMVAGFIVGPELSLIPTVSELTTIRVWADLGVIFLLFTLGLEFHFKKLWNIGPSTLGAAVFEVSLMFLVGFIFGKVIGRSNLESSFIGGLVSISSTSVILKSFQELHLKGKKFTESVFGILIVEDILAVALMIGLTTVTVSRDFEGTEFLFAMSKLFFFLVLCVALGFFLIPTLIDRISKYLNEETTLLLSIALCLLMVITAVKAGFSPALGAFLMGSILGETRHRFKMLKLLSSIKELFAAVFFVSIGMLIVPSAVLQNWDLIVGMVLIVVVGKFVLASMGSLIFGQSFQNSFSVGLSLAQIGEFSFIIASLGLNFHVLDPTIFSATVAVSIITTFTTPFLLKRADTIVFGFRKIIPKKLNLMIERYDRAFLFLSSQSTNKKVVLEYFLRLVINVVFALAAVLLCTFALRPWLLEVVNITETDSIWPYTIQGFILLLSLILMLPFAWAILFSSTRSQDFAGLIAKSFGTRGLRILMFFRMLIVWFLLTVLFSQFFSFAVILILNSFLLLVSTTPLFTLAQPVYEKLENEFIRRFQFTGRTEAIFENALSPWQAHLTMIEVPGDSQACGKSLIELNMREKFGVIITLIQRGETEILAPGPNDRIFPMDRIFAIGTDEQVGVFTDYIEQTLPQMSNTIVDDYALESVVLDQESPFVGKTIRDSGIRETVSGLVVGLERDGHRQINPDSMLELAPYDILWIFGNKGQLKKL